MMRQGDAGRGRRPARFRRGTARLPLRQVPHHRETRKEALARRDHRGDRGSGRGAGRAPGARRGRRGDRLHARSGVRAGQHPLSRDTGRARRLPHRIRPLGRGPRREPHARARHGGAARGRAGQRPTARVWSSWSIAADPRAPRRSPSSARASRSIPAASRSSRPPAWAT